MTKEKRTIRYESFDDVPKPKKAAKGLTDERITAAVEGDPDAAPILDAEWFEGATVVMPENKERVTMRLDRDVVRWFRRGGRGYQTRINAVLRAYVEAQNKDG